MGIVYLFKDTCIYTLRFLLVINIFTTILRHLFWLSLLMFLKAAYFSGYYKCCEPLILLGFPTKIEGWFCCHFC